MSFDADIQALIDLLIALYPAAITGDKIAKRLEIEKRTVQQIISDLRYQGQPIVGTSNRGYSWAVKSEELKPALMEQAHRLREQRRRHLKQYDTYRQMKAREQGEPIQLEIGGIV